MKKPLETTQLDAIVARLNELDGEKVNKMAAPSSTTLSDEQIEMLKEGVFIEGEFLSIKNPIMLPFVEDESNLRGMIIGSTSVSGGYIGYYNIVKSSKVCSLLETSYRITTLNNLSILNGKQIPAYPATDVDKYLSCKQGTLGWTDINLKDIVDDQGNPRFIEGDGTTTTQTGVEYSYHKWSLSATHLMVVVAGKVDNETIISSYNPLECSNIPKWVMDKIVATVGSTIERKSILVYGIDATTQTATVSLLKENDKLEIRWYGSFTATADRYFRFEFDILIDTDAPADNS